MRVPSSQVLGSEDESRVSAERRVRNSLNERPFFWVLFVRVPYYLWGPQKEPY